MLHPCGLLLFSFLEVDSRGSSTFHSLSSSPHSHLQPGLGFCPGLVALKEGCLPGLHNRAVLSLFFLPASRARQPATCTFSLPGCSMCHVSEQMGVVCLGSFSELPSANHLLSRWIWVLRGWQCRPSNPRLCLDELGHN